MTTGRRGLLLAVGAIVPLAGSGCVDRRFVVETNVPGAQIAVDGVPIGPSPTDARWEYAGCYEFTAVAPGYEPLVQMVEFRPKWYQYPPFDFFAEVVYPFRIEDVRRVRLRLEPTRQVNPAALVTAADALRSRGMALPPSSVPDTAPQRAAVAPTPQARTIPFTGSPSTSRADPVGIPAAVLPEAAVPQFGPTPPSTPPLLPIAPVPPAVAPQPPAAVPPTGQ